MAKLGERLAPKGLSLALDDSALELLADRGFDPAFGARPVKRAIQRELESPLAKVHFCVEATAQKHLRALCLTHPAEHVPSMLYAATSITRACIGSDRHTAACTSNTVLHAHQLLIGHRRGSGMRLYGCK